MGFQRQWERRNGNYNYNRGKDLEAFNEKLYQEGRTLHATKGFRPISEKRSRAQMFMLEQKKGKIPPFHWNLQGVVDIAKKFIQTGLWA